MVSVNFTRQVGYLGAAANWLIPIAAIMNLGRQPADSINPPMTFILCGYSMLFVRWAIAISPANYPLMVCHATNSSVQGITLGKYFVFGRGSKKESLTEPTK